MINYFLLAWDPDNKEHVTNADKLLQTVRGAPNDFEPVFNAEGVAVYVQGDCTETVFPLDNGMGLILGRLFHNVQSPDDDAKVNGAIKKSTREIVDSRGEHLTRNYWGSYLTVIRGADKTLLVGRDCSCLQLCYTTWLDGVFCAFSNLDALPFYESVRKDINWSYLTQFARYTHLPLIETGLQHVEQLAGGETAEINLQTGAVEKFRNWRPEEFTENPIEDFETARRTLHTTLLATLSAQAKPYDNIAVMLSGGLDSSILLACLRNVHPDAEVYAKHLLSMENDLSEAHYARAMADAYGVEMAVEEQEAGTNTSYIGHVTPPWPIPVDRDYMEDNDANAAAIRKGADYIESRNIQAFFKGQGGDIVFFKRPEIAPLFDYRRKHPFDRQYYEILMNTARLTQMSVWKLRKAVRRNDRNAVRRPDTRNIFLAADFMADAPARSPYDEHPWFRGDTDFSFGKQHQLQQFTVFNHYAQRWTPSKPEMLAISPFICQPLMEVMLRIPTHIILAGGRNRGLAREAFKAELAPEIYAREQKGYVTKYFFNGLIENLPAIRAYLYDGVLLKQGFLDRAALDAHLNEDSIKTKLVGSFLLNALKNEKWARSVA